MATARGTSTLISPIERQPSKSASSSSERQTISGVAEGHGGTSSPVMKHRRRRSEPTWGAARPDAAGVVHDRDHPLGLLAQRLVELGDRQRGGAQHRVADLADLRRARRDAGARGRGRRGRARTRPDSSIAPCSAPRAQRLDGRRHARSDPPRDAGGEHAAGHRRTPCSDQRPRARARARHGHAAPSARPAPRGRSGGRATSRSVRPPSTSGATR